MRTFFFSFLLALPIFGLAQPGSQPTSPVAVEQVKRDDQAKNNTDSAFGKPGKGGIHGDTIGNPYVKSSGTGLGLSIGGGLGGRAVVKRGSINDPSTKTGKVVVEICVNSIGTVTSADYIQRGSTTNDSELKNKALQAARSYRFASSSADLQCGTITFNFMLK